MVNFLTREKITYVIIGGVAVDVWGKPRKTLDIDIVLLLRPEQYKEFLKAARKYQLNFSRTKVFSQLTKMGMCRLYYRQYHVDFIMGYSDFEQGIFKRRRKVKIFNRNIWVATPEDVILYKLLSARPIDLADIQNIAETQKGRLDKEYLRQHARIMQNDLLRPAIMSNLTKYVMSYVR